MPQVWQQAILIGSEVLASFKSRWHAVDPLQIRHEKFKSAFKTSQKLLDRLNDIDRPFVPKPFFKSKS